MASQMPPDVTVFCDPALSPALRGLDELSRRFIGAPVAVLSAPAALMLAQIERSTHTDILFTSGSAMNEAVRRQLVKPQTRMDGWNNPLVLAGAAGRRLTVALPAWLAARRVAVTDDTVLSGLDGRAVLESNQLRPRQVIGAANTEDAVYLVATGAADVALIYLSDVCANPKLTLLAPVAADPALTRFAGAVNARAMSPNAQRFLGFMRSPAADRRLNDFGLAWKA